MSLVSTRFSSFLSVCAFGLTAILGTWASAADAKENPAYQQWSKFKVGSSASLTGNMETSGRKIQMELTTTLTEVTAEKVVVEYASTMNVMGQEHKNPTSKKEILANDPKQSEMKQVGEEEVEAGGKKYKCKVMEGTGDAAGQSKATAKLWVNSEVPGGMVKMAVTTTRGSTMTYVLKSFEVK